MNIWFKLSPDQATDFQVPQDVATAPNRSFFSTLPLSNLYHSGPWLLLSFKSVMERPFIVTFQPCTVELSFINEFDSFNPLQASQGGQITLNRNEIHGLIELLVNYADQMPNGHIKSQNTFEEIKPEQWANFHVNAHPTNAARKRVFLVQDPASDLRDESTASLVIVTSVPKNTNLNGSNLVGQSYSIAFRQFSIAQLSDPTFSPLNQAVSRIDLDKYGLVELAMLLQKILGEKPCFPFDEEGIRPFSIPSAFPLTNDRVNILV